MERVQVVCLGESMALFVPGEDGPADRVRTWIRTVGGAESNVACNLVSLGVPAAWVSAVGQDALGRAVVSAVAAAGVDVSAVRVDPTRPTGLYIKEADPGGSPARYYRAGSAASAMGPELAAGLGLDGVRILHTSGITAALSETCRSLMRALLSKPRGAHKVSFDVNWRPVLWPESGATLMRELANAADIVLVGADEAQAVWGLTEPSAIRELLPDPETLVIKQGEHGATLIEDGVTTFVPALRVPVVEPVGAGDAFAAGFLAATLAGESVVRRLRAGHLQAAAALRTREDVGPPLPEDLVAELLAVDDLGWASWRMSG